MVIQGLVSGDIYSFGVVADMGRISGSLLGKFVCLVEDWRESGLDMVLGINLPDVTLLGIGIAYGDTWVDVSHGVG